MRMTVVALKRRITGGMTVLAARMLEHRAHGLERDETLIARRCSRTARGRGLRTAAGGENDESDELHDISLVSNGSVRRRLPVSAKTAFATAGAIGAVAGSPIPPIGAPLSITWTAIFGISWIRRIG